MPTMTKRVWRPMEHNWSRRALEGPPPTSLVASLELPRQDSHDDDRTTECVAPVRANEAWHSPHERSFPRDRFGYVKGRELRAARLTDTRFALSTFAWTLACHDTTIHPCVLARFFSLHRTGSLVAAQVREVERRCDRRLLFVLCLLLWLRLELCLGLVNTCDCCCPTRLTRAAKALLRHGFDRPTGCERIASQSSLLQSLLLQSVLSELLQALLLLSLLLLLMGRAALWMIQHVPRRLARVRSNGAITIKANASRHAGVVLTALPLQLGLPLHVAVLLMAIERLGSCPTALSRRPRRCWRRRS